MNEQLIQAVKAGNYNEVKRLLEAGANVHAYDDYALCWAASYGHLEMVKFLLERGANVHAYNDYALRWAAGNGHLEVVKVLKNYENNGMGRKENKTYRTKEEFKKLVRAKKYLLMPRPETDLYLDISGKPMEIEFIEVDRLNTFRYWRKGILEGEDKEKTYTRWVNTSAIEWIKEIPTKEQNKPSESKETTQSEKEDTMIDKIKRTNSKMAEAAKKGTAVSAAVAVERILSGKVKQFLIDSGVGEEFLKSPLGDATVSLGACYLGMMAPELIEHEYAQKVSNVAVLAAEGKFRDLADPFMGQLKSLLEGAVSEAAKVIK